MAIHTVEYGIPYKTVWQALGNTIKDCTIMMMLMLLNLLTELRVFVSSDFMAR